MTDRDFLLAIRQALLMALDALERRLEISPRTSEIRATLKSVIIRLDERRQKTTE